MMDVHVTDGNKVSEVEKFLNNKFGLFNKSFKVNYIETIPRNEYGKVLLY